MGDINKVWLNGQVATDPVLTQVGHDTPSTTFTLKVDETFRDRSGTVRSKTNYIDIEALGRQSSKVKRDIRRGTRVWVEGYLRQESDRTSNRITVRTFAVYKDDTDNNKYHNAGIKVALDVLMRSRDLHAAIGSLEELLSQ